MRLKKERGKNFQNKVVIVTVCFLFFHFLLLLFYFVCLFFLNHFIFSRNAHSGLNKPSPSSIPLLLLQA